MKTILFLASAAIFANAHYEHTRATESESNAVSTANHKQRTIETIQADNHGRNSRGRGNGRGFGIDDDVPNWWRNNRNNRNWLDQDLLDALDDGCSNTSNERACYNYSVAIFENLDRTPDRDLLRDIENHIEDRYDGFAFPNSFSRGRSSRRGGSRRDFDLSDYDEELIEEIEEELDEIFSDDVPDEIVNFIRICRNCDEDDQRHCVERVLGILLEAERDNEIDELEDAIDDADLDDDRCPRERDFDDFSEYDHGYYHLGNYSRGFGF